MTTRDAYLSLCPACVLLPDWPMGVPGEILELLPSPFCHHVLCGDLLLHSPQQARLICGQMARQVHRTCPSTLRAKARPVAVPNPEQSSCSWHVVPTPSLPSRCTHTPFSAKLSGPRGASSCGGCLCRLRGKPAVKGRHESRPTASQDPLWGL